MCCMKAISEKVPFYIAKMTCLEFISTNVSVCLVYHLCELGSHSLYVAASMNLFPQWEQLNGLSLVDNHDISANVAGD